ncbi:MAG TPA: XRE family transcriptional regulator [Gemmatimonadaceae bacterium]|jgi:transcriptional regulator with XRE-family HTH domain
MPSTRLRDPVPDLKQHAGALLAPLLEGWNADDVAALIGTDRPRISELRRGKLDRFSLETLIRYLTRLGVRVELHATPAKAARERRDWSDRPR